MSPEIVQVVPNRDHTVTVYFADGKIVLYNVVPLLDKEVFKPLREIDLFIDSCTIMNDTLAWDIKGNRDPSMCVDVDPEMLYGLVDITDKIA